MKKHDENNHDDQFEEKVDRQETELDDNDLENAAGGYYDDGSGTGCIPDPFKDILP